MQNIDFLPTILSRFDMIFIVKDEHDVAKDTVCVVHMYSTYVCVYIHNVCMYMTVLCAICMVAISTEGVSV